MSFKLKNLLKENPVVNTHIGSYKGGEAPVNNTDTNTDNNTNVQQTIPSYQKKIVDIKINIRKSEFANSIQLFLNALKDFNHITKSDLDTNDIYSKTVNVSNSAKDLRNKLNFLIGLFDELSNETENKE